MVDLTLPDPYDRPSSGTSLGLLQPLGKRSPLGISSATIEQTFPVLQLSVEQTDRVSQHPDFDDEFGFFADAPSALNEPQSQQSPPAKIDQPIQTKQEFPEAIQTDALNDQRDTEPRTAITEMISLSVGRPPLAPPLPLGDRPPLMDRSDIEPSDVVDTVTRSDSAEVLDSQKPLMAAKVERLQENLPLQSVSSTQTPTASESPVESIQRPSDLSPQIDPVVQSYTEPGLGETIQPGIETDAIARPEPSVDGETLIDTEPPVGVERTVGTETSAEVDRSPAQTFAFPNASRSPTLEVALPETALGEIASDVIAQPEAQVSQLIDRDSTRDDRQTTEALQSEQVLALPIHEAIHETVEEGLTHRSDNITPAEAPDITTDPAVADPIQRRVDAPTVAVNDRTVVEDSTVEAVSLPVHDHLLGTEAPVQFDTLVQAAPDDASAINPQSDVTVQATDRAIAADTTASPIESQAAGVPSEHLIRPERPLPSASMDLQLLAEPIPRAASNLIGDSEPIASLEPSSDVPSLVPSDSLTRQPVLPSDPSLATSEPPSLEASDASIPEIAPQSAAQVSTAIDHNSATEAVQRASEIVEERVADSPRNVAPAPDDTTIPPLGNLIQADSEDQPLAMGDRAVENIADLTTDQLVEPDPSVSLDPLLETENDTVAIAQQPSLLVQLSEASTESVSSAHANAIFEPQSLEVPAIAPSLPVSSATIPSVVVQSKEGSVIASEEAFMGESSASVPERAIDQAVSTEATTSALQLNQTQTNDQIPSALEALQADGETIPSNLPGEYTVAPQAAVQATPESVRARSTEPAKSNIIEPLAPAGLDSSAAIIQSHLLLNPSGTSNPIANPPTPASGETTLTNAPTSTATPTSLAIQRLMDATAKSDSIPGDILPVDSIAKTQDTSDLSLAPTETNATFQALPPLGQLQPLVISSDLILPPLDSSHQLMAGPSERSSIASTIPESPVSGIALKPVALPLEQPLKQVDPDVDPEMAPDSWSSIEDLLQQPSDDASEARSWQDVAASLTDVSEPPTVQRRVQDLDAVNQDIEAANLADDVNGGMSFSETFVSPLSLAHDPIETLVSRQLQDANNVPLDDAPSNDVSLDNQDEQLEQLAWKIYHQLRQRFAIECERQGRSLTYYPPWSETLAPGAPKSFQSSIQLVQNQSATNSIELLAPIDAKMAQLTEDVYYQVRSRLEREQERHGLPSQRYN